MCEEYEDERTVAMWRRLEDLERRERLSSEPDETIEPLVHLQTDVPQPTKTKPRALTH